MRCYCGYNYMNAERADKEQLEKIRRDMDLEVWGKVHGKETKKTRERLKHVQPQESQRND